MNEYAVLSKKCKHVVWITNWLIHCVLDWTANYNIYSGFNSRTVCSSVNTFCC